MAMCSHHMRLDSNVINMTIKDNKSASAKVKYQLTGHKRRLPQL